MLIIQKQFTFGLKALLTFSALATKEETTFLVQLIHPSDLRGAAPSARALSQRKAAAGVRNQCSIPSKTTSGLPCAFSPQPSRTLDTTLQDEVTSL